MIDETQKTEQTKKWDQVSGEAEPAQQEEAPAMVAHPSHEELLAQLVEVEAKAAAYEDKYLREVAKCQNIKQRAERDIVDAHRYGIKKMINELLPVIDSLEMSLEAKSTDAGAIKEGVALTLKMFHGVLAKHGVKEVNPIDQIFDPAFHEAMFAEEREGKTPGTVLLVLQKGYLLHEHLIRPARVTVSK